MNSFPNLISIERTSPIINQEKLNPHWISGFTSGDACFTFSIGASCYASYAITLHNRDEPFLLRIQEFFDHKGKLGSYGQKTSPRRAELEQSQI